MFGNTAPTLVGRRTLSGAKEGVWVLYCWRASASLGFAWRYLLFVMSREHAVSSNFYVFLLLLVNRYAGGLCLF